MVHLKENLMFFNNLVLKISQNLLKITSICSECCFKCLVTWNRRLQWKKQPVSDSGTVKIWQVSCSWKTNKQLPVEFFRIRYKCDHIEHDKTIEHIHEFGINPYKYLNSGHVMMSKPANVQSSSADVNQSRISTFSLVAIDQRETGAAAAAGCDDTSSLTNCWDPRKSRTNPSSSDAVLFHHQSLISQINWKQGGNLTE